MKTGKSKSRTQMGCCDITFQGYRFERLQQRTAWWGGESVQRLHQNDAGLAQFSWGPCQALSKSGFATQLCKLNLLHFKCEVAKSKNLKKIQLYLGGIGTGWVYKANNLFRLANFQIKPGVVAVAARLWPVRNLQRVKTCYLSCHRYSNKNFAIIGIEITKYNLIYI